MFAVIDSFCPDAKLVKRYEAGDVSTLEGIKLRLGHAWQLMPSCEDIFGGLLPFSFTQSFGFGCGLHKEMQEAVWTRDTHLIGMLSPYCAALRCYNRDWRQLQAVGERITTIGLLALGVYLISLSPITPFMALSATAGIVMEIFIQVLPELMLVGAALGTLAVIKATSYVEDDLLGDTLEAVLVGLGVSVVLGCLVWTRQAKPLPLPLPLRS
jgi:hypothetical protein